MAGFYSIRPRARSGILRPPRAAPPDPYKPGSKDYEERHRETRQITLSGTVRIDIGEPIKP